MSVPRELRYTKDHEWARVEDGNTVICGVTDYAQEQLGDIVYVEVPTAGEDVTLHEPFGTVESTKSVSDLISPITGVVVEGNTELLDSPQIVNEDPYGDGWIMKVAAESLDELDELMSAKEYEEYLGELDEE
jgi:glycine cleavage system H protein